MGQLSRRGTGLDARSGYGVSEELSRRAHPAGFVEEPEPSKVDGQVLGRDSLEGPEPVLDAAVEGVYVLYVIRPKLVGTARNLPADNPQGLGGGLVRAG